ncbi:GxxExxY protein [Sphingomonas sp. PAMC 26605]|uniref:GxxExxY protein n=1 Tax=Sphingomonas sp. PAMC 26605 TaxID=1112214 RepID=UPI00026CD02A|nr:GxxExxY protein [Sphingomonas sp. PAMC 26605]
MEVERIAAIAIDCGLKIHQRVGPGLLESAYEIVLAHALEQRGLSVERQRLVPVRIDGLVIESGFRADIVVEDAVVIEVKSIERLAAVHAKQVLTYLRFLGLPLGLLMNFGGETFKDGLRRIVNAHNPTGSPLRIHRS